MIEIAVWTAVGCALFTVVCFLLNFNAFRRAPRDDSQTDLSAVSILIPARNEQDGIEQTLLAILETRGVAFEVVVLDDQSEDDTTKIVSNLAGRDARVRLERGTTLPGGWCGKQYACHQLAQLARHQLMLFLDADVRIGPDAVRRCLLQRQRSGAALLSGFPRQRTETLGEGLLIPLIHIVLLSYLPFWLMRNTLMVSAGAGCGQLFLTDRSSYTTSGGHAAIRSSLHDGVTLPRAYRRSGQKTDLFDASDLATCRMYAGFGAAVEGLLKNAHEGFANVRLILPATAFMLLGYVAPILLAGWSLFDRDMAGKTIVVMAVAVAYVPRLLTAARFDRSWWAAALFPISVVLFVGIQWVALVRSLRGTRSVWRGRAYLPSAE